MVGAAMPSPMPIRRGLLSGAPDLWNALSTPDCQPREARPTQPDREVHPGQPGIEAGPQEREPRSGRVVAARNSA
jgi:hypothetical protein